eukprot:981613_1
MSTYTWKITDPSLVRQIKNAKNNAKWSSPTFAGGGFRWYLDFTPNSCRNTNKSHKRIRYAIVFLRLASLPPKVKSIEIAKELRLFETDTTSNMSHTYDKKYMSFGWAVNQIPTTKLQHLTTLTFSVKIDVCGVYDHEDNDLSNQYINTNNEESKHSPLQCAKQCDQKLLEVRLDSLTSSVDKLANSVQSLEQRLVDLEQRTNEEQKDNNNDTLDKLTAEMKVMKQDLRKLSTIAKANPKRLELQSWLENKVGFPQYYDTFVENGIEDLSIASLLTMESIKGMGIDKIGHQMKILRAVTELNHKNINEGDTAYM